jgi:hypothetical protein
LRWNTFIEDELTFPFDLDFYSMYVWVTWVAHTDQEVFNLTALDCLDTAANDPVIASLTSYTSLSYTQSLCNGTGFAARSDHLCVGCETNTTVPSCSTPSNGTIVMPTEANCVTAAGDGKITKHAVALLFSYREETVDTVPSVESMAVLVGRNDISISATVESTSAGGTLYCGAYKAEASAASLSMSRSLVKSSGYSVPIAQQPGTTTAVITLSNLVAATNYSVYCHIEDALANKGSLADMLRLKQNVTTLCCRDIVYSRVSSVVRATPSSDAQYTYTYTIPSFPENGYGLMVDAGITDADGNTPAGITVSPANAIFNDNNRNLGLSRSIVVFASLTAASVGNYSLLLVVLGSASSHYAAPAAEIFRVVTNESLVPAPVLSSAIFADTGRSVSVCFDGDTDQGEVVLAGRKDGEWECSALFNFTGDAFTSCTWMSNRCVEMVFCGHDYCSSVDDRASLDLLEPGENITLSAKVLKGACYSIDDKNCSSLSNEEQSFTVEPPLVPLLPEVFVVASSVGGACQTDLVLDASSSFGSGGRPWTSVTWSVTADSSDAGNTAVLADYLNRPSNSVHSLITVPHAMLNEVVYTFTLRLSNFFQSEASERSYSSVEVDASRPLPTPTVSFDSPAFQRVKAFDELIVSIRVSLPCNANSEAISYRWKVFKDLTFRPEIVSTSPDPQKLALDPYTLEAGATYTLYVTATAGSTTGSALVTVFVEESSSVFVAISGPSSLLLPHNQSLDLNASTPVFKDQGPGVSNKVSLSWMCTVTAVLATSQRSVFGGNCDDLIDLGNLGNVSAQDKVPLKTHLMEVGVVYSFSASYISGSEVLGSDSVTVQVADASNNLLPFVSISSSFNKFNANAILQILGVIAPATSSTLACSWSVYDDAGNPITVQATTPLTRPIASAASSVSYAFSTTPNTFVTGKTYSFRLSARPSSYSEAVFTYASLSATANGPPTLGEISIVPIAGFSFNTSFLFNAMYWIEDSSDYPISYAFRYTLQSSLAAYSKSTSSFLSLGLATQRSYARSELPPGFASMNRTLLCSVLVSDIFGATAEKQTTITVKPSSLNASAASLSQSLAEAMNLSDSGAVGQGVNNAATDLAVHQCSEAPDCSSLHRDDCYDTAHTCGSCIAGYTGIAGDSNAGCYIDTKFINVYGDDLSAVGAACSIDSECSSFFCSVGFCISPTKLCPSTSQNASDACSGHGECLFYDKSTWDLLEDCPASDTNCATRCNCSDNFFGSACSLSWEQYSDRVQSRELMCQGLLYIANQQTPSSELAGYLMSSLEHVFNPSEAGDLDNIAACLEVINILTNVTGVRYLKNAALLSSDGSRAPQ